MEGTVIQESKINTMEEALSLISKVAAKNSLKYNQTKAAEEMNELALVLLQSANKKAGYQPKRKEIVDEIGDAIIRIHMITQSMDITDDEITARILHKTRKYEGYLNADTYREI